VKHLPTKEEKAEALGEVLAVYEFPAPDQMTPEMRRQYIRLVKTHERNLSSVELYGGKTLLTIYTSNDERTIQTHIHKE